MEADYDRELDQVIDYITRIVTKYRAEYDARSMDWLPIDAEFTELRRRRRGSVEWIKGKWLMQSAGRLSWLHNYTGQARNLNVHGEPVWHYETFEERIKAEADRVFRDNRFFGSSEDDDHEWSCLRSEIVASCLGGSKDLIPG
jgi:hypothetical protein